MIFANPRSNRPETNNPIHFARLIEISSRGFEMSDSIAFMELVKAIRIVISPNPIEKVNRIGFMEPGPVVSKSNALPQYTSSDWSNRESNRESKYQLNHLSI